MNEVSIESALSAGARERRDALLPQLLGAVRSRRRRRRTAQSVAVTFAAAVAILWWWPLGGVVSDPRPPAPPMDVAWTVVHDDPTTLQRCRVETVVRAEWFVDDAGLRSLLAEAGRPSGTVRVGGLLAVSPAAIDPWPGEVELNE